MYKKIADRCWTTPVLHRITSRIKRKPMREAFDRIRDCKKTGGVIIRTFDRFDSGFWKAKVVRAFYQWKLSVRDEKMCIANRYHRIEDGVEKLQKFVDMRRRLVLRNLNKSREQKIKAGFDAQKFTVAINKLRSSHLKFSFDKIRQKSKAHELRDLSKKP